METSPIFITGSHRSGSTWIGKILSKSVYTYYLGEYFNPTSRLPNYGVRTWFQYTRADADAHQLHRGLSDLFAMRFEWQGRNAIKKALPNRLQLYRQSRQSIGFPRPILKDPIAVFSAEWIAHNFETKVICLIRHPAGFALSLRSAGWPAEFNHFLDQPELIEDHLSIYRSAFVNPPTIFEERAALLWSAIYHVLQCYIERNPNWLVMRTEDVARSPEERFAALFRYVDLPYSMRLQRIITHYSHQTDRIHDRKANPHVIRRNSLDAQNRWRNVLTKDEVLRIRRIAEPVASHFYDEEDW